MTKANGITLIALVVTIVVLLILAGITISLVFSDNGIIAKAKEASEKTNSAVTNEKVELDKLNEYVEDIANKYDIAENWNENKSVNIPKLGSEMTPIKWSGSEWIETTKDDEEWYDYSAKKWANAVVGGSFNENGILDENSDYSMFVWIPRYAYSITNGYHQSGEEINVTEPTEGAGTIEIEFLKGKSNITKNGKEIVEYNEKTTNDYTVFPEEDGEYGYVVHPAFNYGQEVTGIWVAKFEASPEGATTDTKNSEYNGTDKTLQVKPGVSSWRAISINNIYNVCKNYKPDLNSHLMKNKEWGACVYLSKSKYGKENEEVWINNSGNFITGSAGNSAIASQNVGTTNDYTSVQGVEASTTGNVYGIYDMSGGAWEYVAAYVNNNNENITKYGDDIYLGEGKTKDTYMVGKEDTQEENYTVNSKLYGDALWETSNEYATTDGSWYLDCSTFPYSSRPFFLRGGRFDGASVVGLYCFYNATGYGYSDDSFRPVLSII